MADLSLETTGWSLQPIVSLGKSTLTRPPILQINNLLQLPRQLLHRSGRYNPAQFTHWHQTKSLPSHRQQRLELLDDRKRRSSHPTGRTPNPVTHNTDHPAGREELRRGTTMHCGRMGETFSWGGNSQQPPISGIVDHSAVKV